MLILYRLSEWLHERGANIGTGLVNWNISIGGCVAMGAHRTSLKSDAVVVGGVRALELIDGSGEIRHIEKDESNEEWLAASTSLGLLGIITRLKLAVYPETKVVAYQETLEEEEVLNGDVAGLISPWETANLWVRLLTPAPFLLLHARSRLTPSSGGRTRRSSTGATTKTSP
jgi:L-gulonolactone oxidase